METDHRRSSEFRTLHLTQIPASQTRSSVWQLAFKHDSCNLGLAFEFEGNISQSSGALKAETRSSLNRQSCCGFPVKNMPVPSERR